ncbi:MAG: hypothetical protein KDA64_16235 [Rhodospirillaceae bacterium]|nr:hypothetical protein [Rhodospirillaceae bacterium]
MSEVQEPQKSHRRDPAAGSREGERRQREATALRANLAKRKAQQRQAQAREPSNSQEGG